jgi:predicted nucleic acid-binding protein
MIDVLVDTNMLIYAMDKSSIHHDRASEVLLDRNHNLFTTTKNISEFFAVSSKLKIPLKKSLSFYADLKANISILFPTSESLSIFEGLIQKYTPKGNRVFDVEIVSVMIAHSVGTVSTLNLKDFAGITEVQTL